MENKTNDPWETQYTDEMICPYCKYYFDCSHEYFPDHNHDVDEIECPECEQTFPAHRYIEVTYSTEKRKEE